MVDAIAFDHLLLPRIRRSWRFVDNNFTKFEIATVGSFTFHLVVYLALCLPNIILMLTPLSKLFARYKIQKVL